jgi:hypothetical protein
MEKNSWLDRDYEVATAFDLRKIALLLLAPLVIAGALTALYLVMHTPAKLW